MDAKKRQRLVYVFAAIAMIWALTNISGDSKKKDNARTETLSTVQQITVAEKPTGTIDMYMYEKLEWGRDPFYRQTVKKTARIDEPEPIPGWELGGILWNENNPSAVINKKIVRHGDIINGARVVQIHKDIVTLKKDNTEFTLNIKRDKS